MSTVTRHSITTAHHPLPAPCDHCAAVAPLFRTAGDWICAPCHGWTPADAAAAARQFPRIPCPDCEPAEHAAWAAAARARAAEVIDR
jgi:hypothetical protein